ncbi:MAG: SDR family oxidoreductase [Ignavibacteria bacterium]
MEISLKNRNAIVCGSTQGIGKAIAVEFAKLGANVTLIARNEEALKKVKSELNKEGNHNYIAADFSYPEILKEKITEYMSKNHTVHILVNNTGGPESGNIIDAGIDEFTNAFKSHLICNHILVQAVVEGMKREKYGRIINIVSTSVKQPIKGLGVSNTIRAAVANWSKTLSVELAPYGITVNNILPGATKTERLNSLFESRAKDTGKTTGEIKREWLSEIPAGRFAEPAELAFAAVFLASPSAAYINGVNLPVDGGRLGSL